MLIRNNNNKKNKVEKFLSKNLKIILFHQDTTKKFFLEIKFLNRNKEKKFYEIKIQW